MVDPIEPSLSLREVSRRFRARGHRAWIDAVSEVSIDVIPGSILAIVGASGAGKSTVGRILSLLDAPTSGQVLMHGKDVKDFGREERKSARRGIQVVHQDPFEALDPRFTVGQSVSEGLQGSEIDRTERRERARIALDQVELDPDRFWKSTPGRLSGGQRQRVALARAIVGRPSVIVADEPVSALDVSIRAGVLSLFARVRDELGTSIVLITHDLGTARAVVDDIVVMQGGRIVERGRTNQILDAPRHPYTRKLIDSAPRLMTTQPPTD
ncbi:MAG TPA: ATP-binding cassette domain-containing protein [Lacisediminihabitans sp.]|uniref:ABC transporter ATP-binding protein n=1 Tax=Lacisediminihabitans sp. TaxID=2787631 RepID=UPI002EDB6D82